MRLISINDIGVSPSRKGYCVTIPTGYHSGGSEGQYSYGIRTLCEFRGHDAERRASEYCETYRQEVLANNLVIP